MKAIIIALFAAILLSGCAGTKINWDKARAVKAGMSQEEVVKLMGDPYSVVAKADGSTRYIWVYATAFGGAQSAALDFSKEGKALQSFNVPASF